MFGSARKPYRREYHEEAAGEQQDAADEAWPDWSFAADLGVLPTLSARMQLPMAVALVAFLTGAFASGCSYALHPHRTLDGRPYEAERVAEVRAGMTNVQVEATLGSPLEVSEEGAFVVWRYFERAQLRGCRRSAFGITIGDTPVVAREAKSTFAATLWIAWSRAFFLIEGRGRTTRCSSRGTARMEPRC